MDLDLDLDLGLGPGDWTWGTGTLDLDLDLQEQKDAVGLSGDCSFPVSKVGRAVGGTWDMYPTRMQCAAAGCSLRRGKEPAATAKTALPPGLGDRSAAQD